MKYHDPVGGLRRVWRASIFFLLTLVVFASARMGLAAGFGTASNYAAGAAPLALTAGDLNRDGKADLAAANADANSASVLLGNGDGTFKAAVNYSVGLKPYAIAAGDFNGDGKPDLATANSTGTYSLANLPAGRTYSLKPAKLSYVFTPASRTYTNLSASQTLEDFAATFKTYSVTGRVTAAATTNGISGVTMTVTSASPSGFAPRTATTNGTGYYTFANLPAGRNYVIKPAKTGLTFTPTSRSITNLSTNLSAVLRRTSRERPDPCRGRHETKARATSEGVSLSL